MLLAFLQHLSAKLDEESPGWRAETIILLDGARYHTGEEIREYIHKMQLQVVWSAPYSYSTAPIELLFGGLKFGELNPERLPTGKKVSSLTLCWHAAVATARSGGQIDIFIVFILVL